MIDLNIGDKFDGNLSDDDDQLCLFGLCFAQNRELHTCFYPSAVPFPNISCNLKNIPKTTCTHYLSL